MKRYAIWIILLVVCAGAAVVAKKHLNDMDPQATKQQDESAAYRDGHYLGKLAAERGDAAHVATARWANDSDRCSSRRDMNSLLARRLLRIPTPMQRRLPLIGTAYTWES